MIELWEFACYVFLGALAIQFIALDIKYYLKKITIKKEDMKYFSKYDIPPVLIKKLPLHVAMITYNERISQIKKYGDNGIMWKRTISRFNAGGFNWDDSTYDEDLWNKVLIHGSIEAYQELLEKSGVKEIVNTIQKQYPSITSDDLDSIVCYLIQQPIKFDPIKDVFAQFEWYSTKEKFEYWSGLHKQLKKYNKSKVNYITPVENKKVSKEKSIDMSIKPISYKLKFK